MNTAKKLIWYFALAFTTLDSCVHFHKGYARLDGSRVPIKIQNTTKNNKLIISPIYGVNELGATASMINRKNDTLYSFHLDEYPSNSLFFVSSNADLIFEFTSIANKLENGTVDYEYNKIGITRINGKIVDTFTIPNTFFIHMEPLTDFRNNNNVYNRYSFNDSNLCFDDGVKVLCLDVFNKKIIKQAH